MNISHAFSNLSIKIKILIGFIPVLTILGILTFLNFNNFKVFSENFNNLSDVSKENKIFLEIEKDVVELQRNILVFSYVGYRGVLKKIEFTQEKLEEKFDIINPIVQKDPIIKDRFDRMTGHYKSYKEAFQNMVEKRLILRDLQQNKLNPLIEENHASLNKIIDQFENNKNFNLAFLSSQIERDLLQCDINIKSFEKNPDTVLIRSTTKLLEDIRKNILTIEKSTKSKEIKNYINNFKISLSSYENIFVEITIENRNYLHLVNVVLAGKAAEIDQLARELDTLITQRSDIISNNIIQNSKKSQKYYITLSIIGVMASITLALFIAMGIAKPVNAMAVTLSNLAQKKSDVKIPGQRRKDEVGQMAKAADAFRQMVYKEEAQNKEIKEARRFQELIFKSLPDFLFVKDDQFRLVHANPAFLSMYPEDQRENVIGTTTFEKYPENEVKAFTKDDQTALDEGYCETEETITFPNGEVKTLITKKILFHNQDKEAYILGVSHDITEIKNYEKALLSANEELEEFAYRTSHDLRSPLVSSITLLGMAKNSITSKEPQDAIEALDHAQGSLSKLDTLVQDILLLTEAKNLQEDWIDINIQKTIDDSIQKFSNMDNFDRLEIETKINSDKNIYVLKNRFDLVIENLISNGIKYQDTKKDNSFLKISTNQDEKNFTFQIEDNGLGIPENQKDNIFTMFKRFHPKISFGSGLGLYMMKKSAEIMNGHISYEDNGVGSTFKLTIPIHKNS